MAEAMRSTGKLGRSLLAMRAVLIAVAVSRSGDIVHAQSPGPQLGHPASLSAQGRLLWNFEALLRKRFGTGNGEGICTWDADPRTQWNFDDLCTPLAVFSIYKFVFAHPQGSEFHLSTVPRRVPSFGDYPQPVLIGGRLVACNVKETRFLIAYADSREFTLGCLHGRSTSPLPEVMLARAGSRAANLTTRPVNVGNSSWALDSTYRCAMVTTAGRERLSVQVWDERPRRLVTTLKVSGLAGATEQVSTLYSRFYLRIRATGTRCRWDVWVIRGSR